MLSKPISRKYNTEFKLCECGCGQTFSKYDKRGIERKYIIGHCRKAKENRVKMSVLGKLNKGIKFTEEHKQKIRNALTGNNNGMWTDNPKYAALHLWVKRHFWITRLCQMCMEVPPYDLANITGVYNRNFKNWRYYCRKCHMESDDRLKKLIHRLKYAPRSKRSSSI